MDDFPPELLAKHGRPKLASPISIKDIIEGKKIPFSIGPPEESDDEEVFSDEETLGCKSFLQKYKLGKDFDLKQVCPNFQELHKETWVGVHEEGHVKKQIIRKGNGAIPTGGKVYFTYMGYVEGAAEPFDEAHVTRPKTSFLKGDLPGLLIGLRSMMKGEVAQIYVPPSFGYGELGCPDRIPGGANIIFVVHLKQFIPPEEFQKPIYKTDDELQEMDFRELLKAARKSSEEGNELYRRTDYKGAAKKYKEGISTLTRRSTATGEENLEREKILGVIHLNRCSAHLELRDARRAICDGEKYLRLSYSPRKFKAYYKIAQANLQLNEFDKALVNCHKASSDPLNKDKDLCIELRWKINAAIQEHVKTERNMCRRMFQSGPSKKP